MSFTSDIRSLVVVDVDFCYRTCNMTQTLLGFIIMKVISLINTIITTPW